MVVNRIYKLLALLFVAALSVGFVACSSDDDDDEGGGGGSTSALIGTWARQVQWAETNGLRESSYTFEKSGKGNRLEWDWLDQKYVTENFSWTADSYNIWLTYSGGEKHHYLYEISGKKLSLYFEDGQPIYTYTKK